MTYIVRIICRAAVEADNETEAIQSAQRIAKEMADLDGELLSSHYLIFETEADDLVMIENEDGTVSFPSSKRD